MGVEPRRPPVQGRRVVIDLDDTLVTAHSDKQDPTRPGRRVRVPSVAGFVNHGTATALKLGDLLLVAAIPGADPHYLDVDVAETDERRHLGVGRLKHGRAAAELVAAHSSRSNSPIGMSLLVMMGPFGGPTAVAIFLVLAAALYVLSAFAFRAIAMNVARWQDERTGQSAEADRNRRSSGDPEAVVARREEVEPVSRSRSGR
jgi:membrane protein implicated in regulation of membrane protease activity